MAHYHTSDERYRDLIHDDDDRTDPGAYRFGRTHGQRIRGQTALNRINGYLKTMIDAIASAKVRRMQRELALRGIRYDPLNNRWVVRKSQPTERSQ